MDSERSVSAHSYPPSDHHPRVHLVHRVHLKKCTLTSVVAGRTLFRDHRLGLDFQQHVKPRERRHAD
jgi:hypothetical protein